MTKVFFYYFFNVINKIAKHKIAKHIGIPMDKEEACEQT